MPGASGEGRSGWAAESRSSGFVCSLAQLDSKAISKADLFPRADTRSCSLAPCDVLQLWPVAPVILLHPPQAGGVVGVQAAAGTFTMARGIFKPLKVCFL